MSLRKVVLVVTISSALCGTYFAQAATPAIYNGKTEEARYDCVLGTGAQHVDINITINKGVLPISIDTYAISTTDDDFKLVNNTPLDRNTCHQGLTKITLSPNIILKNCTLGVPIYLYLLNRTQPLIYGGKDFKVLKLDCSGGTNVLYQLNTDIQNLEKPINIKEETPDLKLVMTIKKKDKSGGAIHIGDTLNVTVEDNSSPTHYIAFDSCSASGTGTTTVVLITHGSNVQPEVISNILTSWGSKEKVGSVSVDMSAFRFEGSGNTVTIQCTILACNDNTACEFPHSRRRRSPNEEITDTVEATYTVSDKKVASGQDKAVTNLVMMSILVLVSKVYCLLG